ncbi:MAG: hypothetical protein LV473_10745 [Nitrospira sp.]|nr:hypothetical protein [Nitrospira sp.]
MDEGGERKIHLKPANHSDRIIHWAGYPSWRRFSWLYLMAALMTWRAWLFWRFGLPGWKGWAVGAIFLLGTAAIIRHWAHYEIGPAHLAVRNGYTGHEIGMVKLIEVDRVEIRKVLSRHSWVLGRCLLYRMDNLSFDFVVYAIRKE